MINWSAVREESTRYLQDMVRIDTTNPPGNETTAAEYLASVLKREGFEPQVLEPAPGRGNLVARLKGDGRAHCWHECGRRSQDSREREHDYGGDVGGRRTESSCRGESR